jgi:uncharacterized membrane protein
MTNLGFPELLIVIVTSVAALLPLAIGVWVIVTLVELKKSVRSMEEKLDRIERHGTRV